MAAQGLKGAGPFTRFAGGGYGLLLRDDNNDNGNKHNNDNDR